MKGFTVIDSDNYSAAGVVTMKFPGGEPHVKIPRELEGANVLAVLKLRTWDDVGYAALLLDALEQADASVTPFIPYYPGARQERSDGTAPITLGVMNRLLAYNTVVHVLDFHSHSGYMPACRNWRITDLLPPSSKPTSDVVGIIAPDRGAMGRAFSFRDALYPGRAVIECEKVRDSASGWISGYNMPALKHSGHYIVVDDICDGGATFNLLAQAFDADPIGKQSTLDLVVSHGIFSKGVSAISERYQRIITTASWCDPVQESNHGRLTVLSLEPIIEAIKRGAKP